ncbi:MAG: sugar ABC transporter ATP-binding protein [Eubacterium sp.]|jgi:ABC-type sugar transport system, ATPase component|nr:sugar ABC transporter ATP-binding protein [Eubacterium sp.]
MDNILEVRGLCKYFGSTIANKDVDFELRRGEVHGLAGENGSGKSTLLQQIAGIYHKDEGVMRLNGKEYDPKNPIEARKNKIGIVVQELGVLNTLPAGINVFAGNWKKFSRFGIVNMKKMYWQAEEIFEKYGLMKVSLTADCEMMQIESRKMLELARALADDPDILILDEVTQSLSQNNREMLYRLIERLKKEGKTIVTITHDLEEMLEICDRITVLRDGEVIETRTSDTLNTDEIKRLMVGREVNSAYYREDQYADYEDEVVLEVKHVNVPNVVHDISFELHKGEILGFCGLSDSGIHEIGTAVYGLSDGRTGEVVLKSGNVSIKNEIIANANGMAYVPKDRDGSALMIKDSILNNFVLPSTNELQGKGMYLKPAKLKEFAGKGIEEFQVKCQGPNQKMQDLSGGNKQKVNLGRWLLKDLNVLVLDCPTRGVDVSVKAYIYHVMSEVKKKGLSMILISDELPEVLGMADRLIVMKDGYSKGEFLRGENFTQEALIEVMV